MNIALVIIQALNGIQLGMLLFLLSAGLTLVFGIMNLINLAHGSLYMTGAYLLAAFTRMTGSVLLAVVPAVACTGIIGILVEVLVLRRLYRKDHLDQVLATFALILMFNELALIFWGPAALFVPLPDILSGAIRLPGNIFYPKYRLVIILAGIASAVGLYFFIMKTRVGMLIRAGASDREMTGALGVNIRLLFSLVFGAGAALAGFAGVMAAPILSVETGMGESILILTFVVIIIGGIGSIRGAFIAALLIGMADTLGRVLLPPAMSSMLIYVLMASVLFWRPSGLFPARS